MDQGPLALLIIAGFFVTFPAFWCFVVLLISAIGGWRRLAGSYTASVEPHGELFAWVTGRIGLASYRNTLNVHVAPEGLFLSVPIVFRVGHPPLLLPWPALHSPKPFKLLWWDTVSLEVGLPSVGRIQIPRKVLEARGVPRSLTLGRA